MASEAYAGDPVTPTGVGRVSVKLDEVNIGAILYNKDDYA
jgi:hypothetical protein